MQGSLGRILGGVEHLPSRSSARCRNMIHERSLTHGVVLGEPFQRSISARPIAGVAVLTISGPEPGQRGPWSFMTDTPR